MPLNSDSYTAMVMAACNVAGGPSSTQGHRLSRAGATSTHHNKYCDSTASSVSSCSNTKTYQGTGGVWPYANPAPHHGGGNGDAWPHTAVRYSHNPYASTCTTPSCTSLNTSYSANTSVESYHSIHNTYSTVAPASNAMNPTERTKRTVKKQSSNRVDQFYSIVGSISREACTESGRRLLVSVLRLLQAEKTETIYHELLPHLNTVAIDSQGCHVVRTLIECITTKQVEGMLPYFHADTILYLCTASAQVRRVLQSLFAYHKSDVLTPLVQIISSNCTLLSKNQQGCITIMRVIEHSTPLQKQLLVARLLPVLPELTMDPYGNYVVQSILQNTDGDTTIAIVRAAFDGHWVPLSCNKFASNVMEKVVRQLDGAARERVVAELVLDPVNLHHLMQDSFGNFVLQAVMDSSKDLHEFSQIYAAVEPNLQGSPYGCKIEGRLKGHYRALCTMSGLENVPAERPAVPAQRPNGAE